MKSAVENGVLTVYLEGRIDSTSAEARGAEIEESLAANPHESVIFDAENLEYISSAGLRVVLKTRKAEPTLKIVNAPAEVYDIFEMTGFTEILPVEKAFRKMSVDGCEVVGRGAKGTVYRYNGDTVVKVYKNPDSLPDIQRERELARRAFVLGIPTAISYDVVKVGDNYGSVFELLDAKSYSQLIASDAENRDRYIRDVVDLLKRIHSTEVDGKEMPDYRPTAAWWVESVAEYFTAEENAKLEKMLAEIPEIFRMLHCDFHTNNIMMQNGETLLIDMDTLSHGHPIFDLASVYLACIGFGVIDPTKVENFLGMPYALAGEVYDKFLHMYLDTDDEARVQAVGDKVALLGAIRAFRHAVKAPETHDAALDKFMPMIRDLLARTDSFLF